MAKKYDIRVCDLDANGNRKWHEEHGVMAGSPQELANIYKMCGQDIQVIREYQDEESKNYGQQKPLTSENIDTENGATGILNEESTSIDGSVLNNRKDSKKTNKGQVKYFVIGGIKCKMENGKFYQKQWIKLSEEEMSEFRIVSDKNNKICPIKDKHIEVLKWIQTEDTEKDNENEDNQ